MRAVLATVDVVARTGTVVAIVVSSVAVYFTYKQHQRDTERRREERERVADERRQRDSASLTWEVIRAPMFGDPAQLHVTNSGADAENLRITLSTLGVGDTLGLNPGTVRRGMTATCGPAFPIPMDASSIDWHLDAQWDDATGPRKEHWHLTHVVSPRTRR